MELSNSTKSEPIDNVGLWPVETRDPETTDPFSNEASVPSHATSLPSTESSHQDAAEYEEWETMKVTSRLKTNGSTAL